jgi:hypothetical protein
MSKQKPGDDQHSKLSHEKLAETKLTLERLRSHQTPLVPKTFNAPFLGGPHPFMSSRSREESDRAQADQLIAPPAPKRSPPVMDLAEVIGQQQVDSIAASGQIVFHTVGDTGFGGREDLQEVAEIMAMDFHRPNPADHPAFFLHLGDVVYNHQYHDPESKKGMYDPQFYVPYRDYPGKIVAIPGNHDCNPQEDPHSIQAFEDNFCVDPPASQQALDRVLGVPKRTPMFQPGVYYCLDAPFVNIIALFSNGGETEGEIRGGVVGEEQWNFLVAQLAAIKKEATPDTRKALLVAVHHPPFSGGGHSGSGHMLSDLDAAFKEAKMAPDAILSGHAHNYQRFTRAFTFQGKPMQVPFIVAGNGGHGIVPVKLTRNRQPVSLPVTSGDHTLRQYFNGFGHLLVTVTQRVLTIDLIGTKTNTDIPVDSVTVDLASNTITNETDPFDHPALGEDRSHV